MEDDSHVLFVISHIRIDWRASEVVIPERGKEQRGVVMPILMRLGPYRFLCYAKDRDEPPHVHVERERNMAKLWLDPVRVANNKGFAAVELRKIHRLVQENQSSLLEAWHEFFGRAN